MRINSSFLARRQSGLALIIIMLFVAISLTVFASVMYWVSSNAKVTLRNNLYNESQAAAESATENALASMMRDFSYQTLDVTGNSYKTVVPTQTGWPIQFQFTDLAGQPGQISVAIGFSTWQTLDSEFSGLSGYVNNCTNTAVARPLNQGITMKAAVQQVIQLADVPLFQYAIFYNMDMELNPGGNMVVNGRVHSNDNIWTTGASAGALKYSSAVDASDAVTLTRSPLDHTDSRTGNVTFVDTNYPVQHSDTLTLPLGVTNDADTAESILRLPPTALSAPNAAAYYPTGQVYLYNGADLIVSNSSSGKLSLYYDDQFNSTKLTAIPPDAGSGYTFVTNASFYDYREGKTVSAVQVDVAKMNTWISKTGTNGGSTINNTINTDKTHPISSIYVISSVPMTSSALPAVRLVNGQKLPTAGLTVATALPLYVQGNYNTTTNGINFSTTLGSTTNGNTRPAALMGDALTILSTNWSDRYSLTNHTLSPSGRTPVSTTINAATMEGIVPSDGTHYSGGVENFMRLLENWSGSTTLTYNGSIVVMFKSQYATNFWNGNYYGVPARAWGFDVNFSKGENYLPPLSPKAQYVIRASWATVAPP